MSRLNTKDINGKEYVFCAWRRRWVRLTPEEWVRQQFLHRLVDDYHYPAGRIGVEVSIAVGEAKKRCDAVVYDEQLQPLVLIECKAEHVALTQRTLDQAITYNRQLRVPYLFLHNGPETIVVRLDEGSRIKDERLNSTVDERLRTQDERLNELPRPACGEGAGGGGNSETNVISPSSCVLHPSSKEFLTYIPQWSQL
ncbi:MAG: type I restriction enzyme HsdR N-terminal domain-containing protein [Paludibacteraceae bacterium]